MLLVPLLKRTQGQVLQLVCEIGCLTIKTNGGQTLSNLAKDSKVSSSVVFNDLFDFLGWFSH